MDKFATAIARLAAHTAGAMLLGVIGAFFLQIVLEIMFSVVGLGTALRYANLDGPYWPTIWAPGLILGIFVMLKFRDRAARLTWIPGLLWLAWGVLSTSPSAWRHGWSSGIAQARIDLFPLKQGECASTECLYMLFYTWPALNAITYSIGALLVPQLRENRNETNLQTLNL